MCVDSAASTTRRRWRVCWSSTGRTLTRWTASSGRRYTPPPPAHTSISAGSSSNSQYSIRTLVHPAGFAVRHCRETNIRIYADIVVASFPYTTFCREMCSVADCWPCEFLPRDAVLARYMPSSCVCLCVCVSVTFRYCVKTAKRRITQTISHDSPSDCIRKSTE